jgi:hypothetical protein
VTFFVVVRISHPLSVTHKVEVGTVVTASVISRRYLRLGTSFGQLALMKTKVSFAAQEAAREHCTRHWPFVQLHSYLCFHEVANMSIPHCSRINHQHCISLNAVSQGTQNVHPHIKTTESDITPYVAIQRAYSTYIDRQQCSHGSTES